MAYAKLNNGALRSAPRKIKDGNTVIYNPDEEALKAQGYLPVRYTDPPEVEEGYTPVSGWEERDGEIVQTWTVEADPCWGQVTPDEIAAELEAIL